MTSRRTKPASSGISRARARSGNPRRKSAPRARPKTRESRAAAGRGRKTLSAAETARLASFPIENPYPVIEADLNGRVSFLNPAAERLFPDLRRKGASHPWLAEWPQIVRTCRERRGDLPTREIAVGDRWYQQAMYFAPDAARVRTYGLDVTDRRQAQENLRQSERRYRQLFDGMTEGFALHELICDAAGKPVDYRFLDANQAFERLTGLKRGDLIGRTVLEVLPGTDPVWIEDYGRVALSGTSIHFDRFFPPLDRHYDVVAFAPAPGQFAALFTDITGRKRAEEALRKSHDELEQRVLERTAALSSANAQIWELNRELEQRVLARTAELTRANERLQAEMAERRQAEQALSDSRDDLTRAQAVAHIGSWRLNVRSHELIWSDETYRIFGIPRSTPLTYERFLAAVHPDDRESVDRAWQAAVRGAHYDIEHRILVGGDVRWVRERAELEFGRGGELHGGFGTAQEISERKRTEEDLRRTAAELARSNRDLEQFASAISHDLREPLRMVTAFTGLLKDRYRDRLDARADEYIDFAAEGATRMRGLVDDLLAYARAGQSAVPESTDAGAVLDRALKNLEASIAESGATVTHDPLPTVNASEVGLAQVFQNLIGNAVKFTADRKPEVHVGARRGDAEWVFFVRDNGIGIEPAYAERIFMVFQRLHTREEYPGTGIGLAICKKLVERHGGRIWVEPGEGGGSTFSFTIPDRGRTEG